MDPSDFLDKLPQIRNWICTTVSQQTENSRSLAECGFSQLSSYFSEGFLRFVRVVDLPEVPVVPMTSMGISGFEEYENLDTIGITYGDTFIIRKGYESADYLHFHESIHVLQWRWFGFDRFILAYGLGEKIGGSYRMNPLEEMAYSLQDRFDRGEVFDAEAIVAKQLPAYEKEVLRYFVGKWPV